MTKIKASDKLDTCSFCGETNGNVDKLIVSGDVAICNECIELCNNILHTEKTIKGHELDPKALVNYLDRYIIGQEDAKITISVAIVNHYKRTKFNKEHYDKSNILLFGPSGSGKTHIAKHIAKYLDVPFVIGDATTLTEAGYVGDDATSLINRLFAESDYNIARCENGIIFLDEVDKITRKSESPAMRDVSGEGVQQALLKLVEGAKVPITAKGETYEIDTKNILFIAAGAFVGLEEITASRRLNSSNIGFTSNHNNKESIDEFEPSDFVSYGIIPEFIGRFPTITKINELTKDQLIEILTKPRDNLITQMKFYFDVDGLRLHFESDAITAIADEAIKRRVGARGLRSIMERILRTPMYNTNEYKKQGYTEITITAEYVKGTGCVLLG